MRRTQPTHDAAYSCSQGRDSAAISPMRIRIVEGPGAPAEHDAVVDHFGVVIDGRGYCPLDDLRGIVVVDISDAELAQLIGHGFELPIELRSDRTGRVA